MTLSDYLKFLGISFSASPQEINSAYRKLSRKFLSRRPAGESSIRKLYRIIAALLILRKPKGYDGINNRNHFFVRIRFR